MTSPGERLLTQISAMHAQVNQLRLEADIPRMPVSQACQDLIKYCQEHQPYDILVTGINQADNPFKEGKNCTLL